jgi:Arc/MetJ-type ribon-helix-helix transcriptional regulator
VIYGSVHFDVVDTHGGESPRGGPVVAQSLHDEDRSWRVREKRLRSSHDEQPPELRDLVAKRVADGTFQSEEDVVRAARELLAEQERRGADRLRRLRDMAAAGLADLENGRSSRVTAEDIKRMARERYLS